MEEAGCCCKCLAGAGGDRDRDGERAGEWEERRTGGSGARACPLALDSGSSGGVDGVGSLTGVGGCEWE